MHQVVHFLCDNDQIITTELIGNGDDNISSSGSSGINNHRIRMYNDNEHNVSLEDFQRLDRPISVRELKQILYNKARDFKNSGSYFIGRHDCTHWAEIVMNSVGQSSSYFTSGAIFCAGALLLIYLFLR